MTIRFFSLYQRRASRNDSSLSKMRPAFTREDELGLIRTSEGAVMTQLREQVYTTSVPITRRNDQSQGRASISNAASIHGLPKTVDEVIFLWIYGSRHEMFKPVRLFEKAENCNRLVVNYSHSLTRDGQ